MGKMLFLKDKFLKIKELKNPGIRIKSIITISLILVTAASLFSWLIYKHGYRVMENEILQSGISLGSNLAYNAEYGVLIGSEGILYDLILGVLNEEDVVYVKILDGKGEIIVQGGDNGMEDENLFTKNILKKGDIRINFLNTIEGNRFYEITLPVITTGKKLTREEVLLSKKLENTAIKNTIGFITLIITPDRINKIMDKTLNTIVIFSLLILLAGILIVILFLKVNLKPIEQLAVAARKVAMGKLAPITAVKSRDEIGELSRAFNIMVENLSKKDKEIKEYTEKLEKTVAEKEKAFVDLTAIQSQLIQSEKLAGIGILASGVAHEINNPLQGVYSKAYNILRNIENKDTVRDSAGKIREYSRKIAEIVKELSKYSRDAKNERVSSVDINNVLDDSLKMSAYSRKFTGISVKKQYGNIPSISGNAGQLQQIFINLITNAVDAMDENGTLSLLTGISAASVSKNVSFRQKDAGNELFAEISDTGYGIKEEDLSNIFNPLFTTKEAGSGTGLGLSIAYNLVSKYNGRIEVKSTPGKGTTFRVSLPLE